MKETQTWKISVSNQICDDEVYSYTFDNASCYLSINDLIFNIQKFIGGSIEETPRGATLQKPCDQSCKKCGNEDINQKFFYSGEDTCGAIPNRRDKTTDFVKRDDAYYQPAKIDCIVNRCRNCGFSWDSNPLH